MDDLVGDLVKAYNDGLISLVDTHAPLTTTTIVLRSKCPFYSEELHEVKHLRRWLERKWRNGKLTVHHQIYREQCAVVNKLLRRTKTSYYSDKIKAYGRDQRITFKLANHLLGDKIPPVPNSPSSESLPQNFSDFFTHKIINIRTGLMNNSSIQPQFNMRTR